MAVTIIGGNQLSPFYSQALLVPFSGAQVFTPWASVSGGWQLMVRRANPRRRRGLADATHSMFPQARGKRQTQVTFEAELRGIVSPDGPPESELTLTGNATGYQLYLTLGALANYPAADTNQYYYWVPSVFVREIPHEINVEPDPVPMMTFDLAIESNGPAFFLPTDTAAISTFVAYAATFTPQWTW